MTNQTKTPAEPRDLYQEAMNACQRFANAEGRDLAALCADALTYDKHTERRDASDILWETIDGCATVTYTHRAALYLAGCSSAYEDAWTDCGAENPTTEQRAFYALLSDVTDRLEADGWDMANGHSPAEVNAIETADLLEEDAETIEEEGEEDAEETGYVFRHDDSDAFRAALVAEMEERGWDADVGPDAVSFTR
jgi:hypothetical protein